MRLSDASRYEILFDLPKGAADQREVGAYKTKTIRAGDSIEVEAFPMVRISDGAKREAKRRKSTAAQDALNLNNTRKHVRRLLEENFSEDDYALHPTFNYGVIDPGMINKDDLRKEMERAGLPMDEDDARRMIKNYIKRIRRHIKRMGGDPKALRYLYTIESTKEPKGDEPDPLPAHYHYHMAIGRIPGILEMEDLIAMWTDGYAKCEKLDFRFNGLEGFAKYITKQKKIMRRWARSKNLREPKETISHRKISRKRAALIADDVRANAREIFEKLYPGYRLEAAEVKHSDFVAGAFIYARMRKITTTRRRR